MNEYVERLLRLRQHQRDGHRSPHKPLLALLALGQIAQTGSSRLTWSEAEQRLSQLLAEFAPSSASGLAQRAAYPFTRLRSDGVWTLDAEVRMDDLSALRAGNPIGQFESALESQLLMEPGLVDAAAVALAVSHFPESLISDVLIAVGFNPEAALMAAAGSTPAVTEPMRRRDPNWRLAIIDSWDRCCAFCGYDGQLGGTPVGLDAAHVRWFAFEGPDALDNGLALCSLHHKLFDRGALGLDEQMRVLVSTSFTARTTAGRGLYELHGRELKPRPGTVVPRAEHVGWHTTEVFKGLPLAV